MDMGMSPKHSKADAASRCKINLRPKQTELWARLKVLHGTSRDYVNQPRGPLGAPNEQDAKLICACISLPLMSGSHCVIKWRRRRERALVERVILDLAFDLALGRHDLA